MTSRLFLHHAHAIYFSHLSMGGSYISFRPFSPNVWPSHRFRGSLCRCGSYVCHNASSRSVQLAKLTSRMLTLRGVPLQELPYVALVLVEPTMIPEELFYAHFDDRMATMEMIVAATSLRRDKWPSREDAFEWFRGKTPWKTWDSRTLRLLVVSVFLTCYLNEGC